MEIRVTVETRDAKFTEKFDVQDANDVKSISMTVDQTILEIIEPPMATLPKLDIEPGFVDAELSATEFRLLTEFRTASAALPDQQKGMLDSGLVQPSVIFAPVAAVPAAPAGGVFRPNDAPPMPGESGW